MFCFPYFSGFDIERYRDCTTGVICSVFPIFQGLVCKLTVTLSDTETVLLE